MSTSQKSTSKPQRPSKAKARKVTRPHDTESLIGRRYRQIEKRAKKKPYEPINTEEFDRKYRAWLKRRGLNRFDEYTTNTRLFTPSNEP